MIENSGYALKELDLEHWERSEEIFEKIYDKHLGKKEDGKQPPFVHIGYKKKGACYEVWTINEMYFHRDTFLKKLKKSIKNGLKKRRKQK